MDDRTWIREDTLTMQLAIPLDLCSWGIGHTNIWTLEANGCGDVDLTHTCLQHYSHIGHIGVMDHPCTDP